MTSKFKVGDKVKFIRSVDEHKVGQVKTINQIKSPSKLYDYGFEEGGYANEINLELVESKPTKNQRITALEETVAKQGEEIAELKLIVAQIRKPSTVVQEALDTAQWERGEVEGVIEFEGKQYRKVDREALEGDVVVHYGSTHPYMTDDKPYKLHFNAKANTLCYYADSGSEYPLNREYVKGYDVYEEIKQDVQRQTVPCVAARTPNEKRAEIIEKAKVFIESCKTTVRGVAENGSIKGRSNTWVDVYSPISKDNKQTACYAEFIAVEKKRKVVALLKGVDSNKVYAVGETVCNPSDVFNEHIGRAIALGRALGLDVSEFEQVVQPSEVVVGTDTHHFKNGEFSFSHTIVDEEDAKETNAEQNSCGWTFKIINDTNAQYGGVE